MYEELTRKAADLASENENLKKKKELAAKEYDSLKNENASLRIQIAKIEKAEAEETDGSSKLKPVEISTTSTALAPAATPTSLFNQSPVTPFFWPSIVQPFNSFLLQCSTPNISDITSVLPSPTAVELNSINRQDSSNPGNPLYVLPFPCLTPFHPQNSPFLPWSSTLDKHAETSWVHQCSTSYLNMENNQAATAQEGETDAPDIVKATQRDFLHRVALGFPLDGGASEGSRQPHSREMVLMTATSSSHIHPGTSGQSHTPRQHNTPDIIAVSRTAGHVGDTSEKTFQGSITCSSEKLVDAICSNRGSETKERATEFERPPFRSIWPPPLSFRGMKFSKKEGFPSSYGSLM